MLDIKIPVVIITDDADDTATGVVTFVFSKPVFYFTAESIYNVDVDAHQLEVVGL